jgi:RHS repeat-associated protein
VLEERVGGVVQVQYVWSPVYVDALVLRDRDADGSTGNGLEEWLWVQQDANFNVTALVDGSGNVVERYVYDPYGAVTVLAPNWTVRGSSSYGWVYQHQGIRLDSNSGLYHFRKRDYSPALGRWTSQDPLGFAAGDTNLYRFVGNSPTTVTDPSGLAGGVYLGSRPMMCPCGEGGWTENPLWWFPLQIHHRFIIVDHGDGTFSTYSFEGVWITNAPIDLQYTGWWWRIEPWPSVRPEDVKNVIREEQKKLRPWSPTYTCTSAARGVLLDAAALSGVKPPRQEPYGAPGVDYPIPPHMK